MWKNWEYDVKRWRDTYLRTQGNNRQGGIAWFSLQEDPSCSERGWQTNAGTTGTWWWSWRAPCSPPFGSATHDNKLVSDRQMNNFQRDNCFFFFCVYAPPSQTRRGSGRTRTARRGRWSTSRFRNSGSTSDARFAVPQRPPSWSFSFFFFAYKNDH